MCGRGGENYEYALQRTHLQNNFFSYQQFTDWVIPVQRTHLLETGTKTGTILCYSIKLPKIPQVISPISKKSNLFNIDIIFKY